MITPQYLLEGTMYALEQCGILLRDAETLYNKKAYSNAIVLAAFAREELGRSRILCDLRKRVIDGESVTVEDIRKKYTDHVEKQKWGQLSTVQRASDDQGLGKLLRARHNHLQSEEYQEDDKQLDDITSRQGKRTPDERHKLRERARYVQLNDTGTSWNRPCKISQDEAREFLGDAANDYRAEYDRIQQGSIQYIDDELFHALQAWPERPELPRPPWLRDSD